MPLSLAAKKKNVHFAKEDKSHCRYVVADAGLPKIIFLPDQGVHDAYANKANEGINYHQA